MRILLTANASYVPPRGGATRSNLVWLDNLSRAGHQCRVVAATLAGDEAGGREQMRDEGIAAPSDRDAIRIWSVADPARRVQVLREQIRGFLPDWVLVSSEDLGHGLIREAHQSAPGRVVYLAHTPQFYPFGPASWNPDANAAELVARSAAIVAIGHSTAAYIERYVGRKPAVIHPPIYGRPPFRNLGAWDRGFVTMINPCVVKGIGIFLDLARRFPAVAFAALPGWGTTPADRRALEALPNITLLPNAKDIEQILERTRVLLMPSLWYEGFGLIVTEAMLRGIPVVSSDAGGLIEAKMGTAFVVPVKAIEHYAPVFDERNMPRPVLESTDLAPWAAALETLLGDRAVYERESQRSREAALRFVEGLEAGEMERMLESLDRRPRLRILLAQNSLYYPSHGGGDKSNRLLMEALAARGHVCRVVARIPRFGAEEHRRYLGDLAARSVDIEPCETGTVAFRLEGVDVRVAADTPLRSYFAAQAAAFAPDVILASTDDPAQLLLEAALSAEGARVVYLVRATLAVPFGPDCAFPSASKTDKLRRADAVVGVSQYVADYVRRYGGMDAVHVPISLMEPGDYPELARFGNEFVTLVNPCAVKGISILLALAERMPEVRFAAVPTWGTNEQDRAALAARPNIRVLDPVDDIDKLLARTRVLLVPSLWAEARSRIVLEAMLRGVPVLAANVGGIPEAKMGVDYLLPVRPIEKYAARVDEQMVPVAEVPPQDVGPWQEALTALSDPARYERLSRQSREAALDYVGKLSARPFEGVLYDVLHAARKEHAAARTAPAGRQGLLDKLSPERRRLLALRLRKKTSLWFPAADLVPEGRVRLFCFPHAGGGASGFHRWAVRLPQIVGVCPARLPGRELRASEEPLTDMTRLVDALGEAMLPYTGRRFAFFGHSMGAVVAFELARWLRRHGKPAPAGLFVSGARAPQFRRDHVPPPEPAEDALIAELRRIGGIPAGVLEDADAMRLILPALQADAALYRNYVYSEDAPLDCPIRAYGGTGDPNVCGPHLEGWARQTSASFALTLLEGGHFFLQSAEAEFLGLLAEDLRNLL